MFVDCPDELNKLIKEPDVDNEQLYVEFYRHFLLRLARSFSRQRVADPAKVKQYVSKVASLFDSHIAKKTSVFLRPRRGHMRPEAEEVIP
jgi:hypothetical protein